MKEIKLTKKDSKIIGNNLKYYTNKWKQEDLSNHSQKARNTKSKRALPSSDKEPDDSKSRGYSGSDTQEGGDKLYRTCECGHIVHYDGKCDAVKCGCIEFRPILNYLSPKCEEEQKAIVNDRKLLLICECGHEVDIHDYDNATGKCMLNCKCKKFKPKCEEEK